MNRLKQKEESLINGMNSDVDDRRQLLDLTRTEIENIKTKISDCGDLFVEAVQISNGVEDCNRGSKALAHLLFRITLKTFLYVNSGVNLFPRYDDR